MPNLPPTVPEICAAIQAEINASPTRLMFEVVSREHDEVARVWTLEVEPKTLHARLDESLQGVNAWWPSGNGEPGGVAEVLAVVPEDMTLHLWRYSGAPPAIGGRICLFPRQFLESLLEVWRRNGTNGLASLGRLMAPGAVECRFAEAEAGRQAISPAPATAEASSRRREGDRGSGWNGMARYCRKPGPAT